MPIVSAFDVLFQELITTSWATKFTTTADDTNLRIHVCNYSSSDCWVGIRIAGAGNVNIWCDHLNIPAYGTYDVPIIISLQSGKIIEARAEANSRLNIHGFGVESTATP